MPTRIVWITMLALADRDGHVRSSESGLARLANVTAEDCHHALERFLAPEIERGGTPDYEGRRIEEVLGGWLILNYAKYRDLTDAETRREQWRTSQRKRRQQLSTSVNGDHPESAHTEAEADADTKQRGKQKRHPIEDAKTANGEASLLLANIRALAVDRGGQSGGKVVRRDAVVAMGEDILAAYDAIGGSERILAASGKEVGFVMREFRDALAVRRR